MIRSSALPIHFFAGEYVFDQNFACNRGKALIYFALENEAGKNTLKMEDIYTLRVASMASSIIE
jgi:hypothetical protein